MAYVKSDKKQFWGTADSQQRVINNVSGFANPEPSSSIWYHLVIRSPNTRKPQSTVRVTKNEGSDNHPERLWGIAHVLAVQLVIHIYILYINRIYSVWKERFIYILLILTYMTMTNISGDGSIPTNPLDKLPSCYHFVHFGDQNRVVPGYQDMFWPKKTIQLPFTHHSPSISSTIWFGSSGLFGRGSHDRCPGLGTADVLKGVERQQGAIRGMGWGWWMDLVANFDEFTRWLWLTVRHGIDGPFIDDFPIKTSIYKGFSHNIEIHRYGLPFLEMGMIFHGELLNKQMLYDFMARTGIFHGILPRKLTRTFAEFWEGDFSHATLWSEMGSMVDFRESNVYKLEDVCCNQ